jgi:hypothetical protein
LGLLVGAIALAGMYRQRFFLGGPREWGIHWEAIVLEWAKWPAMLAALLDVLTRRQPGYIITRKVGADPVGPMLLVPHGLAAALVASAWVVGMERGLVTNPILHVATATVVIGSLGLIATERLRFPEPYEPCLTQGLA